MFRRTTTTLACAFALALSALARAAAPEFSVALDDGPLSISLKDLERQTGVELLYDGDVIRNVRSPAINGRMEIGSALQQMLDGSELSARRASSGAWIIERQTTAPLAQQDVPVAEILVVGRRTQNADIRRTEDDVQPYFIATREDIVRSHRETLDQFISSRVTSNTTILPSITSQDADVMSSIDLRGMGDTNTIVLVDGRRMPSLPDPGGSFRQSDLNAIPLHAIERVEVLTGAAGGIHGFGALGGVVNVVVDRDIDGLAVYTTQGISSRGDGRRRGIEASFGRSFNEGATDFMLHASHQELETPRVQDRGFALRDRRRTFEFAPDDYPYLFGHGNSLTVSSTYRIDPDTSEVIVNPELTFKPEFGGQALGSNLSYLPLGFSGDSAALAAALRERAGQYDFSVDGNESRVDMGPNPRSAALLANFRHRFSPGWETYVDVVMLRNRGESFGNLDTVRSGGYTGSTIIEPTSPANPFTDQISVSYPIYPLDGTNLKRIESTSYTAGIEAALPLGWRGTVEASRGRQQLFNSQSDTQSLSGNFYLVGDPSDLEMNPLLNWESFDRLLKSEIMRFRFDLDFRTRFSAQSLRLAGPVFETRAGPSTLTLLAERRSERMPPSKEVFSVEVDSTPSTETIRGDPRARLTRSFYGEFRSQLFDELAPVAMLRDLELQLAVRHDRQEDEFPSDLTFPGSEILHSAFAGTAYTAGAKISPSRWLMLRGSYSTGEQPPPSASLVDIDPYTFGPEFNLGPDPKRGGTAIAMENEVVIQVEGSSKLKMARASTLFLGAVLTPTGEEGPRFSVDYSRIHRARDLATFDLPQIVAHEDAWPERVVRAPLTDEDRANGYTGGLIEGVDTRVTNDGVLEVEAYDFRAEWPLSLRASRFRLYADATYQKVNVRKERFEADTPIAGYRDGPLKRRANAGVDWTRKDLSIGANLQYLGSSLVSSWDPALDLMNEDTLRLQGSSRIPSQTYLDLYGTWRVPATHLGPINDFTLDFGIVNALDKAPPRVRYSFTSDPGYSRYADPRMRRFELSVSCRF